MFENSKLAPFFVSHMNEDNSEVKKLEWYEGETSHFVIYLLILFVETLIVCPISVSQVSSIIGRDIIF